MTTIATENTKTLRAAMEVHCGFSVYEDVELTFASSGAKLSSNNLSGTDEMLTLADFAGDGFLLDGSAVPLPAALPDGYTYGVRTNIGGSATITITPDATMSAIVLSTKGEGKVTFNGIDYNLSRSLVIPMTAETSAKVLTLTSMDADARAEVSAISAGVEIEFDNDNLISCNVNLRADLTDTPTLPISEIEIQGMLENDLTQVLANIDENTPIWFYAGYPGDYSQTRNFYTSDQIVQEGRLVTIKGEDATKWMDESIERTLHLRFDSFFAFVQHVKNMLDVYVDGITFINALSSDIVVHSRVSLGGGTMREIIADLMNLYRLTNNTTVAYKLSYVDAGIPTLKVYRPETEIGWNISESFVSEVTENTLPSVRRIYSADDYGINAYFTGTYRRWQSGNETERGSDYTFNCPQGWIYSEFNPVNGAYSVESKNGEKVIATALKDSTETEVVQQGWNDFDRKYQETKYKNYGLAEQRAYKLKKYKRQEENPNTTKGRTVELSALMFGQAENNYNAICYPSFKNIFNRSTKTGSFRWRGNPKMQPRDVFTFVRLDGTEVLCTIESISLNFEGGGLTSEIVYREGRI